MNLIMSQKTNDSQIPKNLKDRNEARFIQFKRKMKMKISHNIIQMHNNVLWD